MQVSAPSFAATLRMVERNAAFTEAAEKSDLQDPALSLEDFVRSAAETRKAFAQDRLKQLREQMTTLMLFNLKPDALKHFSAQFGRELENAATDFSRSVRTLNDRNQVTPDATPEDAYLDSSDSVDFGNYGLGEQDREIANSFMGAAAMINTMVELSLASRDNLADRRDADRTQQSLENVVKMMTRLDTKGLLDPVYW